MEKPPKHGSRAFVESSCHPGNRDSRVHSPCSRGKTSSQVVPITSAGALLKAPQQRHIRLHDAEAGIVQQHGILDGIKSVGPLAVRAQNLFQQPQILHRKA